MIHDTIHFTADGRVKMRTYIHEQSSQREFQIKKRPAIIIMAGGAYSFLSDTEREPVALTFLKEGFNTFILDYSVGDYCQYPGILEEVSRAIWEVRRRAEEWYINPNAVVVMGFSAGACLAAMSATQWNTPGLAERLGAPAEGIRPDAAVVGYAPWDNRTIQNDPKYYNPECAKIAKDCTPELDFINYTGTHMPPMFIWNNRFDKYVPPINQARIAEKLIEYDIPFEMHIFQGGEHGMSVCNNLSSYNEEQKKLNAENPNVAMWVPMCVNWINSLFGV